MAEKAGRLEIDVVADASGLAAELRAKVNAASRGLEAEVGVEVDGKGLRSRLRALAEVAGEGISAEIGVRLDRRQIRDALTMLATELSEQTVSVGLRLDGDLGAQVRKEIEEIENNPNNNVDVGLNVRRGWKDRLQGLLNREAASVGGPPTVPVDLDFKGAGSSPLLNPGRMGRIGRALTTLTVLIATIGPVIGPVLAAIASLGAALGALGGVAVPAAASGLAAIPSLIGGLVQALAVGATAFSGFGNALGQANSVAQKMLRGETITPEEIRAYQAAMDNLTPSAQEAVRQIASFSGEFTKLRKIIQENFFEQFDQDIKPLLANTLPILNKYLGFTASIMGRTVSKVLQFVGSKGFGKKFGLILDANNQFIADMGDALVGVIEGVTNLMVAARPLLKRIGGVAKAFGDWAAGAADTKEEQDRLTTFLEWGADLFGSFMRIVKQFGRLFGGIFDAGSGQGEYMLARIESALTKMADWANSEEGGQRISAWFDAVMPAFYALVSLIGAVGKAFGRIAELPGTVEFLNILEEQMVPALERLITVLSENGPMIAEFFSDLVDFVAALVDSEGFKATVDTIVGLMGSLADTVADNEDVADALGMVFAGLVALKAFSFVAKGSGLLNILGAIKNIGGAAKTTAGSIANLGNKLNPFSKTPKGPKGSGPSLGTRLLGTEVYWKRAMPVYITNPGGGDTTAGGGDGKDPKKKPKGDGKPKGRASRVLGGLGRGARFIGGGLVAAAGLAARPVKRLIDKRRGGPKLGPVRPPKNPKVGPVLGPKKPPGRVRSIVNNRISLARGAGKDTGALTVTNKKDGIARRAAAKAGGGGIGSALNGLGRNLKGLASKTGPLAKAGGALKSAGKFLGKGGPIGIIAGLAGGFIGNKVNDQNRGARSAAGGAISGAATGAGIGALVGSVVPGVGTAIGAGVGGVIGGAYGAIKASDMGKVAKEVSEGFGKIRSSAAETFGSVKTTIGEKLGGAAERIGLFKTDAEGKVTGLNLAGPAATAAYAVTSALSPGLADGLTRIGVFKTDSEGKVTGINLAAPAAAAATAMANALPPGIKSAGEKIGLFKRDAEGKVTGVDLAGPGKKAVNKLAQALPEGVQKSLTELGIFKRDANGKVNVDLSGTGRAVAKGIRKFMPNEITSTLETLGIIKTDAAGRVSVDLTAPGKKIITTLMDGIKGMLDGEGGLWKLMDYIGSNIAKYWPQSPVKRGPLKGMKLRTMGAKTISMIADGMKSSSPQLQEAMSRAARMVKDTDLDANTDGYSKIAAAGAGISRRLADYKAAQPGGSGVVFEAGAIVITNPVPEPASVSMNKRLRAVNAFGLFDGGA